MLLPTIKLGEHNVTRLICGGNPFSGFSHVSAEFDQELLEYYTMPNLLAALDECIANGINTFQSRGDRHQSRMYLEHRLNGGSLQWIAQTASEMKDLRSNIRNIIRYKPVAIYHHGSHTDNMWHAGKVDELADIVKFIKDQGLPAGIASHIPEVIQYIEEHEWETDFYLTCFYNLARRPKLIVAEQKDPYSRDVFPPEDPEAMAEVIRQVPSTKTCFAYKVLAAGRNCSTPDDTRRSLERAFNLIKPTDAIIVGVFQKYKNQIRENAGFVRDILACASA